MVSLKKNLNFYFLISVSVFENYFFGSPGYHFFGAVQYPAENISLGIVPRIVMLSVVQYPAENISLGIVPSGKICEKVRIVMLGIVPRIVSFRWVLYPG
jgi:hypothetical protein